VALRGLGKIADRLTDNRLFDLLVGNWFDSRWTTTSTGATARRSLVDKDGYGDVVAHSRWQVRDSNDR